LCERHFRNVTIFHRRALCSLAGAFLRGYWKWNFQQWNAKPATRNYFKWKLIINIILLKYFPKDTRKNEHTDISHIGKTLLLDMYRRTHAYANHVDKRVVGYDNLVASVINVTDYDLRSYQIVTVQCLLLLCSSNPI